MTTKSEYQIRIEGRIARCQEKIDRTKARFDAAISPRERLLWAQHLQFLNNVMDKFVDAYGLEMNLRSLRNQAKRSRQRLAELRKQQRSPWRKVKNVIGLAGLIFIGSKLLQRGDR